MKTPQTHPLARLWRYARPHRRRLVLASVYSFLNKAFDLAPPALIGAAVDIVVTRENSLISRLGYPDLVTQLWILAGITLVVWGFESLFQYAYAILWRNLAQTLQHELRLDAYGHVQSLELAYFEDRSTGGLMSVLNDDINQLERFLDGGANDIIQLITTVLIIGGIFFALAPSVAGYAHAAHALYHLGLDPVPAAPGPALCGGARACRVDERPAGQQPGRDRDHQKLHCRVP